jgi:hypothetical protein
MTPPLHLLNGDQLAYQLQGASYFQTHFVFREALIVGPVGGTTLVEFWKLRTEFITSSYGVTAEEYNQKTISEIERLRSLPEDAEICLWFEDDLFCQVNLWFLLAMLSDKPRLRLFRVFPPTTIGKDQWDGFGQATLDSLEEAFEARVPFCDQDVQLGKALWQAYRSQDWEEFKSLSRQPSPCFQSLEEVCQAQLERLPDVNGLGKPERIIYEILGSGINDFPIVFNEFTRQAGVYGFGDLQVKALYDRMRTKP